MYFSLYFCNVENQGWLLAKKVETTVVQTHHRARSDLSSFVDDHFNSKVTLQQIWNVLQPFLIQHVNYSLYYNKGERKVPNAGRIREALEILTRSLGMSITPKRSVWTRNYVTTTSEINLYKDSIKQYKGYK